MNTLSFGFSPGITPPVKSLQYRGNTELLGCRHRIGVIGSRNPSEYGRRIAKYLGKFLSRRNVPVVSGMAIGIDSSAQMGADGYSIGVSPLGLNHYYPKRNEFLFHKIQKRGLLVSEYEDNDSIVKAYKFVMRNRIIAGLSTALIIVEASLSSGTIHTLHHALAIGMDIWCIPGRITDENSQLCNQLISEGAFILHDIRILEERYDLKPTYEQSDLSPEAKRVMELLHGKTFTPKTVADCLNIPEYRAFSIINELEMERMIQKISENFYSFA